MDGQQHRQHPQIPHSSSDSATHLHPPLSSISSSTASTSTRTRTRTRTTTSFRVSVSRVDDMAGLLHETEEDGQHDNTFSRHQRSRSFPVLSSSSSSSQQRRHQYHYYHHHHHHTSNHLQRSSDEDNSGDEEERAIAEEIKRLRLQREIENEDSDRQKGWRDGKEARLAGVDPTLSTCTTTTTTTSYPLPSPSSSSTRRHRPPSSSSLKDGQHLTDTLETPTSRSSRRSKGKKIRPSASSSSLNDASSTGSSQVASPSSSSPRHRHRSHRHRGARSSMTVPSSPTFGATKAFDRDGPSIPPGSRLFERRAAPSDVSHHSSSVISAFDFQKLSPTAYLSKVYSSLPKPRAPIPVPPLRDSVPSSIQLVSHRLRSYDLVPLQKALSLSFYLFLSVGAGLALVAILVTSYLLTIADDARVRVHQMSDRAYAVRNWMASNSRGGGGDGAAAASDENRGEKDYHPHPNSSTSAPHSQHGSSSNGSTPFSTPSSSTPGSPRLGRRDLPTDDARGTRKQASSNKRWNEFLPLSFSLFFVSEATYHILACMCGVGWGGRCLSFSLPKRVARPGFSFCPTDKACHCHPFFTFFSRASDACSLMPSTPPPPPRLGEAILVPVVLAAKTHCRDHHSRP